MATRKSAIKTVRELTGLGLADAKKLTETPDGVIKEKVNKSDADAAKEALEAVGATIAIK